METIYNNQSLTISDFFIGVCFVQCVATIAAYFSTVQKLQALFPFRPLFYSFAVPSRRVTRRRIGHRAIIIIVIVIQKRRIDTS